MSALAESLAGASSLTAWFVGGRVGFCRAARMTTEQTRALLMQRAQQILRAHGIQVEVSGTPPAVGQGCVVVYNETSFADVFAFNATVREHIDRHAVDQIYGRVAFGPAACERLGLELVPRKNRAASDRLIARMADTVRAGERVAWGGEGGFSGSDTVRRFKVGASLIAIRARAPLLPLAFRGGHAVMPLRGVRMRPGIIRVRYGSPIPSDGMSVSDARALADRAHEVIARLYQDLKAGPPDS
jgi:1-acyl-sn-glycerol-3-phosphate acyltransferase